MLKLSMAFIILLFCMPTWALDDSQPIEIGVGSSKALDSSTVNIQPVQSYVVPVSTIKDALRNASMQPIIIQLVQAADTQAPNLGSTAGTPTPTPTSNPTSNPTSWAQAKKQWVEAKKQLSSKKQMIDIPPTPSFDIIINKRYKNSPKIKKLYARLGVKGSPSIIHFVTNRVLAEAHHADNIFFIQPRSFQGIITYLSLAVEVTQGLLQQHIVQAPKYPDGTFFNINEITRGILKVHMSNQRPRCNANVSVFYRNHWYYIADNDLDSKRTFRVLQQLFNLQAGEIKKEGPVLTIPVR